MAIILHGPVCDLLGCPFPIVLAGMGGVARSELVNAVTKAGGFGGRSGKNNRMFFEGVLWIARIDCGQGFRYPLYCR